MSPITTSKENRPALYAAKIAGRIGAILNCAHTREPNHESLAYSDPIRVPELPRILRKPVPVIVVGMTAWMFATIFALTNRVGGLRLEICFYGLGVGLLGAIIVGTQLAAVRRGSKTAQKGLE